MAGGNGGDGFEGALFADLDVDDDLGKDLQVGGELVDGFAGAGDEVEDHEGGEQAVAGGGQMGQKDVAGLLAAERGVVLEHLLEHIAVADGGAQHADAGALERGFQAHVGHGGGDDQIAGEQAAGFQVACGGQQDGVAVEDVVAGAGHHAAVGVAVKGEAEGRSALLHFGGDIGGMKSAAVVVDVAAVGGDVEEGDGVQSPALRRRKSSGAMAAAAPLAQSATMRRPCEREAGDAVDEELNVVVLEGGVVFDRRQRGGIGSVVLGGVVEDFVFHGQLDRVGQLEAVGAEELDAVVAPGIVGGGDDNARLKPMGAGEEGDGRGGHDAGAFNAGAGGAQSGGEGGGDPGAGLAGVAAKEDGRLGRCVLRREWARARPTAKMVVGSRGDSPATARMPSVPKSLRVAVDVIISILEKIPKMRAVG